MELKSNNELVFTSITATSEGSSDETETCSAGEKKNGENICESCPGDTHGADGMNCNSCPDHSTSEKGATSISDCKCLADRYMESEICQECTNGKKSAIGSTSVDDCKSSNNILDLGKLN